MPSSAMASVPASKAIRLSELEPLYVFERAVPLSDANKALAKIQYCLELNDSKGIDGRGPNYRARLQSRRLSLDLAIARLARGLADRFN